MIFMNKNDDFYNSEWKELFLNSEYFSKSPYISFFQSMKPYEEALEKDVALFTRRQLYETLESLYLKRTTVLGYTSYLKKYARFLQVNNFLDSNSYSSLDISIMDVNNIKTKPNDDFYTESELQDLIEHYSYDAKQMVGMIIICHYHGVSFEEMSNMELADIEYETNILRLKSNTGEFRDVEMSVEYKKQLKNLSLDTKNEEAMTVSSADPMNRYLHPKIRIGDRFVFRGAKRVTAEREQMEPKLLKGYIQENTRTEPLELRTKNTLIYNSGFTKLFIKLLVEYKIKNWKELRFSKEIIEILNHAYPERNVSTKPSGEMTGSTYTKIRKVIENDAFPTLVKDNEEYLVLNDVEGITYPEDIMVPIR